MKHSPSVAIVIPTYNEASTLPQALKRLDGLCADELIFVDGGSTDESRALIQAQGHRCLFSELGRAKQMNTGAQNTESDIILFLHIDTSLSSSDISSIKKSYNQGFLSGRFNIKLSNPAITYCIISFFINLRSRLSRISTGDQGMFVRRDVFDAVGGFPDLPLMEDVAMSKRLKQVGKVACLSGKLTTSSRRWEQHGIVRTVMLMWKIRFLYWLGISPAKLVMMYRHTR